ncbi:hypothetical protein GCK32_003968 [Trichostrongylus colubriformis]|uniref:Uncharacterized protein n=1 Tax=Trichostrongylus colubriformis TaxID=6319 RepID=A0AAN8IBN2_TRICO
MFACNADQHILEWCYRSQWPKESYEPYSSNGTSPHSSNSASTYSLFEDSDHCEEMEGGGDQQDYMAAGPSGTQSSSHGPQLPSRKASAEIDEDIELNALFQRIQGLCKEISDRVLLVERRSYRNIILH